MSNPYAALLRGIQIGATVLPLASSLHQSAATVPPRSDAIPQNVQFDSARYLRSTVSSRTAPTTQFQLSTAESRTGSSPQNTQLPQTRSSATALQTVSLPAQAIRVRVAEDMEQVSIAASGTIVLSDADGKPLAKLQSNALYQAMRTARGLQISSAQLPSMIWVESSDQLVSVNDRWYRGRLLLVNTGDSILAVNVLPIEQYLYGVVGAEMYADWHSEALKAQAVAARSYALRFIEDPLSQWFDIGNDENFQVYQGISREAETTIAAVEATHGQVLVKENRILLAEYAANEAITVSAHRGQGMSQTGAQVIAEQGWSYRAILAAYYPSAAIAAMRT